MKAQILYCLVSLFVTISLNAQHHESDDHSDKKHNSKEHHDDHGEHNAHKNHIALFNGATTNFDHSATDYTIGIDYEFRISDLLGVGLGAEYILTDDGEIVVGLPVFIHPVKGLKLCVAAIGVNAASHSDDSGGETHKAAGTDSSKKEWHYGARIGAAYDIHVGKVSVSPTVAYDITNTQAMVYGLAIGFGF